MFSTRVKIDKISENVTNTSIDSYKLDFNTNSKYYDLLLKNQMNKLFLNLNLKTQNASKFYTDHFV